MTKNTRRCDICVLGAGIMGCCLALELARRGRRVRLLDRAPLPMTKASLHNEGKLHLGFVYAKDPHKATHRLLARGSLAFARIIRDLTGQGPECLGPSEPFHYYVPADSQLDVDAIHRHFHDVSTTLQELSQSYGDVYLGTRVESYFERNAPAEHARLFSPRSTLGSFRTEERSVSPLAVANILRGAVDRHPNIEFAGDTEVLSVGQLSQGRLSVESRRDGATATDVYASVANCLWEDRMRIDSTFGLDDPGPWYLRYKAAISVSTAAAGLHRIPSSTGILGPYGDVVNHGNGSYYVSWYPLCKLAETVDGDGRRLTDMVHSWPARSIRRALLKHPAVSKRLAAHTHGHFVRKNLAQMSAHIPQLAGLWRTLTHYDVGGGVIVARGSTDIDDPGSYLHQRSRIGSVASGSYVSVDTGKYCTAPLFAVEAADTIAAVL